LKKIKRRKKKVKLKDLKSLLKRLMKRNEAGNYK